jgi:hypothetical protein
VVRTEREAVDRLSSPDDPIPTACGFSSRRTRATRVLPLPPPHRGVTRRHEGVSVVWRYRENRSQPMPSSRCRRSIAERHGARIFGSCRRGRRRGARRRRHQSPGFEEGGRGRAGLSALRVRTGSEDRSATSNGSSGRGSAARCRSSSFKAC